MIELIISITVIALLLAIILNISLLTVKNSVDPQLKKQAHLIAQSLMDEIMSKRFSKPTSGFAGPYDAAHRHLFDTVSDYNTLWFEFENGMTSANTATAARPELSRFFVSVVVQPSSFNDINSANAYLINLMIYEANTGYGLSAHSYRLNYNDE